MMSHDPWKVRAQIYQPMAPADDGNAHLAKLVAMQPYQPAAQLLPFRRRSRSRPLLASLLLVALVGNGIALVAATVVHFASIESCRTAAPIVRGFEGGN